MIFCSRSLEDSNDVLLQCDTHDRLPVSAVCLRELMLCGHKVMICFFPSQRTFVYLDNMLQQLYRLPHLLVIKKSPSKLFLRQQEAGMPSVDSPTVDVVPAYFSSAIASAINPDSIYEIARCRCSLSKLRLGSCAASVAKVLSTCFSTSVDLTAARSAYTTLQARAANSECAYRFLDTL